MKYLDNLVLFFLTLSYTLFDREGLIQWFYLMEVIFIGYYFLNVFRRPNRNHNKSYILLKLYGLFFFFCLLSIVWSIDKEETFLKSRTIGIIFFNSIIFYDFLNKSNSLKYVLLSIILATYINFFILLKLLPDSPIYWDSWRFQGTRDNPNYLSVLQITSIYAAISLIKLFSFKSKVVYYFIYLSVFVSVYVIFMTASKKGIFFSTSLVIYFLIDNLIRKEQRSKKIVTYLLMVAFFLKGIQVITLFLNSDKSLRVFNRIEEFTSGTGTSTKERYLFMQKGFENFMDNPFFGTGISTLKSIFGTYSHSNIIEILSGLGIIGFLIYYSMYFTQFKKIFKIENFSLKILNAILIISLIILDFAQVTYYYKFSIFTLIFTLFIIENTNSLIKYKK